MSRAAAGLLVGVGVLLIAEGLVLIWATDRMLDVPLEEPANPAKTPRPSDSPW